jgi:predicted RNA binding protein YcfA (HicA-like mRNA interferase family)
LYSRIATGGFYIDRQVGSHIVMYRDDPYAKVTIPEHNPLKPGTLKSILRQAGLTVDEFVTLLKK